MSIGVAMLIMGTCGIISGLLATCSTLGAEHVELRHKAILWIIRGAGIVSCLTGGIALGRAWEYLA